MTSVSIGRSACLTLFVALAATGASAQMADPRVGLRAGVENAGQAARGLELVAHLPRPAGFFNPENPDDFGFANSDMAFRGNLLFLGNYSGIQIWDISTPARPVLRGQLACPGGQGDVSVHGDLMFMSVEETRGRVDCGKQGVEAPVSAERFRGVRVFNIADVANPRQVAAVQTCRGSHTHTLVPDPTDASQIFVYVSGTSRVRPGEELAGCAGGGPADPATALFRVEVIRVPLANPERAAIVTSSRFLLGLTAAPEHGPGEADRAAVAAARARGAFIATVDGNDEVLPDGFARQQLDAIVRERGGTGAPTAADSAAFRAAIPALVARMMGPQTDGPRPGPNQCHDITAYPEIGLAGGACAGYGILLDIRDPANPARITAAADSNFAYWHSATFSNDGKKVVFTDEWGGGTAPRCRATDRMEWGANALFTIGGTPGAQSLSFDGYYKMPGVQTEMENCVAHNGSLVPVPGRDLMIQAWYQGGLSLFDFTDPAAPVEVAFFDRGPMNAERLVPSGYWSAYWYNGHIYASEIGRGLDVFRLTPGAEMSANEIAAATAVQTAGFNAQTQTRVSWPATATTARATLDGLVRDGAITASRAASVTRSIARPSRRAAAAQAVERDARTADSRTADRLRSLATTLRGMSGR